MCVGRSVTLLSAVLLFGYATAQDIPDNQKNACVSVNETDNVTYTCTSEEFPILWRVGSRQIRDTAGLSSNGIIVTTSSDSEGYNSAIVFTEEGIDFLAGMVGDMEIEVVCLVERDVFDIVEGDIRTFLIYNTPPPPDNLRVVPTNNFLLYNVVWSRPAAVPDCVTVNYKLSVTNLDTGMTTLPPVGVSSESYRYNDTDSEQCQLHEFRVLSLNDAGEGQSASTSVTLPISPNVVDVSSSLMARPLLDDGIAIEVMFDPATACDVMAHPILNYIISITELPGVSVTVPHTRNSIAHNLTSNLLQEDSYTVTVMACASFTCLSALPVTVVTSEVQAASITFLNTTVSLECEFIVTGSGRGCRFTLNLPDGQSETIDLDRPSEGGVVSQKCATTQNMREAYLSIKVQAINSNGGTGDYELVPFVNVTEDVADISPCEPPTPEIVEEVVEKSTFSTAEIAAIIIAVLVVFSLLLIVLVIIVWWKRQAIRTAYKNFVHVLSEEEGIDLIMDNDETDKPTLKMLLKNLHPFRESSAVARKKSLTREASQQPDLATGITSADEEKMALQSKTAAPASPPPLSGKEPVAAIKMKDDTNAMQLLLKSAALVHAVRMWKSKINRGDEMLLYWKEDEEDIDDDEPYFEDPEDTL